MNLFVIDIQKLRLKLSSSDDVFPAKNNIGSTNVEVFIMGVYLYILF